MATTEPTINDALASVLAETRSLWRPKGVVRSENTGVFGGAGKKPDILIVEPNVSPVVIETEVVPAASVESDARERLGQQLKTTGGPILSSLAIRMPERLRNEGGAALRCEITNANDFEICVYAGKGPTDYVRWPRSGWLRGGPVEISILAQSASVPPEIVDQAARTFAQGVSEAAGMLSDVVVQHPGSVQEICKHLRQEDSEQTRRMAMAILTNALLFEESVTHGPGALSSVRTRDELRALPGGMNKHVVIDEWKKILAVNYWAIFDIAERILSVLPAQNARAIIERLAATADELIEDRLLRSHDLTGAVFQRLIVDRKFLAAYYTEPSSAALLVGLAVVSTRTPANGSWSDPEGVKDLRLADFACGTGTILSAAYQRISQLHEAAGGDAEKLHPSMMASALFGCDVLPAAAHLTASMLATAHPTVTFNQSSVIAVEYGRQSSGRIALGSLDLLSEQQAFDAIGLTGALDVVAGGEAVGGAGPSRRDVRVTLPHESFDLILMNPPFTRDTGHEGKKIGVPNPMFAAFESSGAEQSAMVKAMEKLLRGTSYHGNAGEASAFLVLADRKLKDGGTLALVMPLSLMSGEAWEKSRQLLRESYGDLIFVSIAGARDDALSFSADTGMGECLVIGRKTGQKSERATFVVLDARPDSPITGATAAAQVLQSITGGLRKLEDGPVGGTPIYFGNDRIGYALDAPLPPQGAWNVARISDPALAQAAYQLAESGLVWLPGMTRSNAPQVTISTVAQIGKIGPYHMDINADTASGGVRGPFEIRDLKPKAVPTYRVLWHHDADRERCLEFEGDSEGIMRKWKDAAEEASIRQRVDQIANTASHCHFNRDLRFNSQSTAMQFTAKRTIGGRSWPSISLASADEERVLTLWGNCTLGLLLHWWHANKPQAGRGSIGITALQTLPVLEVTALSKEALAQAVSIFEDLKDRPLRPVNEIANDPVRAELDERLCRDVLGMLQGLVESNGPLALVRHKLAVEPSIAGGKPATTAP